MSTTSAHVNIAYSGTLANDFSNFSDYAKSLYGSLNGFATDLGCNYQWKDKVNHATKTVNTPINTSLMQEFRCVI